MIRPRNTRVSQLAGGEDTAPTVLQQHPINKQAVSQPRRRGGVPTARAA
jgi:hypothetical protein